MTTRKPAENLRKKSQPPELKVNPSEPEGVLETSSTQSPPNSGNSGDTRLLMEKLIARGNILSALQRVERNKGAPGIDGMETKSLREHLVKDGAKLREELLDGSYRPQPVRRVEIPKASGGGKRKLGIPTVRDRLVQQAMLQVLNPIFDPTFSEGSFGFRIGRSAQKAVAKAQSFANEGFEYVVDIDLEAFFDKVNHDKLMHLLRQRIEDQRVLDIIRRFLNAGMMEEGLFSALESGVPQGGPLSPLLSNLMLDVLDKELERRGHCFVRYADDCNVYVKSTRSGERVMASLRRIIEKDLKLKINESKSAVDSVRKRKFLGVQLWRAKDRFCIRLSSSSEQRFKARIRELTNRNWGISFSDRIRQLNDYLRGWSAYFRMVQTPSTWPRLQSWILRRLRSCQLKQWKRPQTRYRKLRVLGILEDDARKISGSRKGPWCLAFTPQLHKALGQSYWRKAGLLFLEDLMRPAS